MHNFYLLVSHVAVLLFLILLTLRLGERALHAWLCVIAVSMNLFVSKQITLFGLDVTATDALAVSYLLGFNLMQEFYGKATARSHLLISFLVSSGFVLLSFFQIWYEPNDFDVMHSSFNMILRPLPRIISSSIFTFVVVQAFDIFFFGWLREKFNGKMLVARLSICLVATQIIDTCLFSFLALYGQVGSIYDIIEVSLCFKYMVIALSLPFAFLASKFMNIRLPKIAFIEKFLK